MPLALSSSARRVPGLAASPRRVLAAWPRRERVAALWSGGGGERARWTILGEPAGAIRLVRTRHGAAWRSCGEVPWGCLQSQDRGPDLFAPLDARASADVEEAPFLGGWIGWVSYDAGRLLEPERLAAAHPEGAGAWPLAEFSWCPAALAFDHRLRRWWLAGEPRAAGPIQRLLEGAEGPAPALRYTLGRAEPDEGERRAYLDAVRRAVELVHAGDVYQVNVAHRLRAPFRGSVRGLFERMARLARPWYGALLESPPDEAGGVRAVASASPEQFLSFDPRTRRVTTRPMKGTRPASAGSEGLAASGKDRAELAMIVDLMRNDLGRVCEFGSVRVERPRVIERHGARRAGTGRGVWQATATVSGTLRESLGLADLLGAAFPAGSVTGAPKVRAMQVIDELEPVARGPYCGAIGFVSRCGTAAFNVAIRTAALEGSAGPDGPDDLLHANLDFSVGAGIVAESDAAAEWRETLDKAWILRELCNRSPEEPE